MNTALSKIGKKGFARFLVMYLSLALALPATPLMAKMGDITDNSGYIPLNQAFFAFEVEGPIESLKTTPTWDELEKILDNPYAYELDTPPAGYLCGPYGTASDLITGRPLVDATGRMVCAGTGNDQLWPAYRRTDARRRAVFYRDNTTNLPCQPGDPNCNEVLRSFLYRIAGTDNACVPGPLNPNCVEVPLPRHFVHPLNYNPQSGEELRLLNIEYAGSVAAGQDFSVPGDLFLSNAPPPPAYDNVCRDPATGDPLPVYRYTPKPVEVSPGIGRVEEDDVAIDYNGPIQPDSITFNGEACVRTLEFIYLPGPGPDNSARINEGVCLCGGDPGEPGYAGFGTLAADITTMYSTPAVPGKTSPGSTNPLDPIGSVDPGGILAPYDNSTGAGDLLYDPVRGFIYPRDPVTGFGLLPGGKPDNTAGVLRKPSVRIALEGCVINGTGHDRCGSPIAPNYLWNSYQNLFELARLDALAADNTITDNQARALAAQNFAWFQAPSNENDYILNREAAAVLGKAIFWDQQLGSDSVQACASCHFHAGADNRTKNQLNPNHLSGDLTFQIKGPNQEIEAKDFPFHKLYDHDIAGDPACILPLVTPFGRVACDASNIKSDSNDVMSSMGVFFGNFGDIPPIGSFNPADNTGVRSVPPDIRTNAPLPWRIQIEAAVTLGRTDVTALNTGNLDPIPAFQGVRRVEPRNTPTLFGATMNFDNFWDGRARHDFNGGSVFGASDNQAHVWVNDNVTNTLVPTRQIIRFNSLASLFTGPALSEFEMSQKGRNWQKIGKKLLQAGVTPLANQLVDPTDTVLGPYSNQGGANNACASLASLSPPDCSGDGTCATAPGKPGLCISYRGLIKRAYYPALWENQTEHLNGSTSGCLKPMKNGKRDPSDAPNCDPFDAYVLALDNTAPANSANTNQFTQMEANASLFFGLGVQAWGGLLIPDDTPMDRFFDNNPDAFKSFGESGESFLVLDLPNCSNVGNVQSCFTEVGNFKRDTQAINPGLHVRVNCSNESCTNLDAHSVPTYGTRNINDPDPLLGLDFFLGSNLSLKNPNFRSLRCGECHKGGTLTDHTFEVSHQMGLIDWIKEFVTPGLELFPEPLTRGRVVHPFAIEGELGGNAQDAVERNTVDLDLDEFGFPRGQSLLDNGMYNIGVRPIHNDQGRGGDDAFGWPLSLSVLALKNLGGADYHPGGDNAANGFALPPYPGIPLPNWEPDPTAVNDNTGLGLMGHPIGGGLYLNTAQDPQINPGFESAPAVPLLPPYLAKWANDVNVGQEIEVDEVFVGLNTLLREPILEGFIDTWGPFNPSATLSEAMNNSRQKAMGTWPVVNRVNVQGAFKAPPLRNVELTGPYFHNGGKLTLRQQVDFYDRGGDFPVSNSAHRALLITKFDVEDEALGGYIDPVTGLAALLPGLPGAVPEFTEEQKEAIRVAIVDFLLELTDDRVAFERAPFDHPELIIPLDGTAPENHGGRPAMLASSVELNPDGSIPVSNAMYLRVPPVGEAGNLTRMANFLNIKSGPRCTPIAGGVHIDNTQLQEFGGRVVADIPECTGALSHYDSDTERSVPVGSATGTTSAATAGATAASTGVTATSGGPAPAPLVVARSTSITPEVSGTTFNAAAAVASVTLGTTPSGEPAAGSTITLSASATGGSGSYEYRFWVHDGTSWSIVQDYSPADTFDWKPSAPGTYIVQVHARSAGSTAAYEAWTGIEYTVQ